MRAAGGCQAAEEGPMAGEHERRWKRSLRSEGGLWGASIRLIQRLRAGCRLRNTKTLGRLSDKRACSNGPCATLQHQQQGISET